MNKPLYKSLPNGKQSKLERRTKFRFLKYCGLSDKQSQRMRDWSYNHIVIYLSANAFYDNGRRKKVLK